LNDSGPCSEEYRGTLSDWVAERITNLDNKLRKIDSCGCGERIVLRKKGEVALRGKTRTNGDLDGFGPNDPTI